jgi:hypothetical protein
MKTKKKTQISISNKIEPTDIKGSSIINTTTTK